MTDRSRLRKLLSWTAGLSDEWRIDTELAGTKTVTGVTRVGGKNISYGFNFEEASTYPQGWRMNPVTTASSPLSVSSTQVQNALVLDVVRTLTALEWLFVSRSMFASLMIPVLRCPLKRLRCRWKQSGEEKGLGFKRSPSYPLNVKIIGDGSSDVPQTHLLEIKTHSGTCLNWPKMYPNSISLKPQTFAMPFTKVAGLLQSRMSCLVRTSSHG